MSTRACRILSWGCAAVAAAFCVVWLWDRWCVFPANYWNDLRLAPAYALQRGVVVYDVGHVIAHTWMYGPLPLMLAWPVRFAGTAAGVLEIGGALTVGATALTVAMVAWTWPGVRQPVARFLAALIAVLLLVQPFFTADAPAIGFGLLSSLFLVHRKPWAAAIGAVAAVACKQIAVGILAGQLIWLLTCDRREAGRHLFRCAAVLAAGGLLLAWLFGARNLWQVMVVEPSQLPWTADFSQRLKDSAAYLTLFLVLPVAAMALRPAVFWRRDSILLLPTITFFSVLPLSLAALFKTGGNLNSLYSFALWLPPVAGAAFSRLGPRTMLGCSVAVAALGCFRLGERGINVVPEVQAYREAEYLTNRAAGRCWFPTNPLVTLVGENRYYHDEDGLYQREVAGSPLSEKRIKAGLPRQHRVTVFPHIWMQYSFWGIAEKRLPRDTAIHPFGRWWVAGDLPRLLERDPAH